MVLRPPERLIVAADFARDSLSRDVESQVLDLADRLADTGVVIKVNSALRLAGYGLITKLHDRGLKVFADLKLCDISATMAIDGNLLADYKPAIVTAMADAGAGGLQALKKELPDTEVLAVLILSNLTKEDVKDRFGFVKELDQALKLQGLIAKDGTADGVICAPKDLYFLKQMFGNRFSYVTPGIRDPAEPIKGDDQNPDRTATPEEAIRLGADRLVVGRPIMRAPSPRDVVMRFIEAIDRAAA